MRSMSRTPPATRRQIGKNPWSTPYTTAGVIPSPKMSRIQGSTRILGNA